MRKTILLLLVFMSAAGTAFPIIYLSDEARASLVTAGPGREIYQLFGHSVFRIFDLKNKLDVAYNFGTVPFSDPHFVRNFVHGDLWYEVDRTSFQAMARFYTRLNRSLREYELNLSTEQVQRLYEYMEWHIRPENRKYLYLFFHDNCSTRIRDMFKAAGGMELELPDLDTRVTFRQLLKPYLRHSAWTRLGLFFMLNSMVDMPLTSYYTMGLPEYLEHYFRKAWIRQDGYDEPLVLQEEPIVLNENGIILKSDFWYSPFVVFSLLFIAAVLLTFFRARMAAFDFILFFVAGLLGIFLLFLWLGTNHIYGHHNWNLIWALPAHAAGAFFVFRKSRIREMYFSVNTVIMILILPASLLVRQRIPLDALPFILALFVRSFSLSGISIQRFFPAKTAKQTKELS
ncbi:MAG: DUF4105 domain-containing protein [Spirochaetales bacterium]|nr:DUF4105 domain-containing protein [Spirochaetales bacterium]